MVKHTAQTLLLVPLFVCAYDCVLQVFLGLQKSRNSSTHRLRNLAKFDEKPFYIPFEMQYHLCVCLCAALIVVIQESWHLFICP